MVGDTKMSVVNIDHIGWLKCDGRLLNVNDYYFLWQTIGYSFGGSGLQFYLPDPSGRVAGFIGNNGTTTWNMGDLSGEETHTLTIDEMPTHNHDGTTDLSGTGITDSGHTHDYTITNDANRSLVVALGGGNDVNYGTTGATTEIGNATIVDPTHQHDFTTNNTGGSNAHNNIQPTIFMGNMFIYSGKPNQGSYPYFAGGLF
jgi:microcystin-dependent protein